MKHLKREPGAAAVRTFLEPTTAATEEAYRRVLDAISLKRRNPTLSLSRAAKASGTTLKTIRHHAAEALVQRLGRTEVKPTDHLRRKMEMLTRKGDVDVTTTDSDTASMIASYWNAIRSYRRTGNVEPLETFVGRSINVEEGSVEFVTDMGTLNRLIRAGAMYLHDIYASTGRS
jgi:hypothetical protein